MKTILLTQGKYAIVDDEDYEYLRQWKWFYLRGYSVRSVYLGKKRNGKYTGKTEYMHRVIAKTPNGKFTDHVNQDKLDNRGTNLRTCNKAQNSMNRTKQINNTSGHKGVSWNRRLEKWESYIWKSGKKTFLGYFTSLNEAARAYNIKALELHGSFAKLNLI